MLMNSLIGFLELRTTLLRQLNELLRTFFEFTIFFYLNIMSITVRTFH